MSTSAPQPIEALTLPECGLGDGGLAQIAPLLQGPRGIARLNLRANGITGAGVSALASTAAHARRLTSLSLRDNPVADMGACILADSLVTAPSMTALDLCGCAITAAGAVAISQYLRAAPVLASLRLARNALGHRGAVALAAALAGGGGKRLQALDLRATEARDDGVAALSPKLGPKHCPQLLALDLGACPAGSACLPFSPADTDARGGFRAQRDRGGRSAGALPHTGAAAASAGDAGCDGAATRDAAAAAAVAGREPAGCRWGRARGVCDPVQHGPGVR